jgi:hypothetical protein
MCARKSFALYILITFGLQLHAQNSRQKISFNDSADHEFDLSDYVIHANGFVPVPIIVTEPALGGFGGGFVPVFIKRRPPYKDSVNGKIVYTPVAPDLTGGIGFYTVNDTWMLAGFRSGTWLKYRIKYVIAGGFANINLGFYRDVPQVGKTEFNFNFKSIPFFLQGIKRIGFSHWYAGLRYAFMQSKVYYAGTLPSFVKPIEENSLVSQLGAAVELDNRDNIFSPNSGMKVHFDGNKSAGFLGSDYDYWRLNYYMFAYLPILENLIGGWRVDGQQVFGSPPFYLLPYISMRGVPVAKYQGNADLLTEGELRWDFVKRWSIVGFGGIGKAFDNWNDFGSVQSVVSYGGGFRYLIARKFGLRMGLDLAHSPGTFAYYIIFGSNWQK